VPDKPARQRLNREVICAAALELAAESGSADVSMRALGDRLGVDATAVYRHFADKDDLMRAVGDRALAPATKGFTTSEDPADDVRRMCTGIRKALLKNQVGLLITSAGPTRNANELRITEVMLDALLVAIIGANIMAPEMVDAANAVMARLRGTRWRPEAMSR
jgi:AcrR family transcriptional regulator